MNKKIQYADCWTPSERKIKRNFEKIKAIIFNPFIFFLLKLKITANMLSYFSAFVGLISVIYMWYNLNIAAVLLIISLTIDGLDGSIARATKTNNLQGSVTDSFCDQIVISASTIGFIAIGLLNPIIGGVYLTLYPLVIIFSILRNIINKPATYVLRPRIIVYSIFVLYVFTNWDYMNFIVLILSIILFIQVIKDFYFLRSKLNE